MGKLLKPKEGKLDYKKIKVGDKIAYSLWSEEAWEPYCYTVKSVNGEMCTVEQLGKVNIVFKTIFNNRHWFLLSRSGTGFGKFIKRVEDYE